MICFYITLHGLAFFTDFDAVLSTRQRTFL